MSSATASVTAGPISESISYDRLTIISALDHRRLRGDPLRACPDLEPIREGDAAAPYLVIAACLAGVGAHGSHRYTDSVADRTGPPAEAGVRWLDGNGLDGCAPRALSDAPLRKPYLDGAFDEQTAIRLACSGSLSFRRRLRSRTVSKRPSLSCMIGSRRLSLSWRVV